MYIQKMQPIKPKNDATIAGVIFYVYARLFKSGAEYKPRPAQSDFAKKYDPSRAKRSSRSAIGKVRMIAKN